MYNKLLVTSKYCVSASEAIAISLFFAVSKLIVGTGIGTADELTTDV